MAEKGKVVLVYSLTSFGKEMAGIAANFERRIRIDALEELRVAVISEIERIEPFIITGNGISSGMRDAYHKVIDLIAAAKRRVAESEMD